jgi:hypothetical protein
VRSRGALGRGKLGPAFCQPSADVGAVVIQQRKELVIIEAAALRQRAVPRRRDAPGEAWCGGHLGGTRYVASMVWG